ncbi:MAG: ABC transporter ATP-binding protein [Alkalispirochaetaceae bacterium]
MNAPHLTLSDVVAGYGDGYDILKGINLDVEEGQSYCIIGPNGAGKSTLLKTITGLLKPRSGSITFRGEEIGGKATHDILRRGICFVPQDRSLFPDMTVTENLRMGGFVLEDRSSIEARIEDVYRRFPILKDRRKQKAGTLSGGEQQMLAIARTLILRPEVILLDEPSLGLAPKVARDVFESIRTLQEEGMTIVLVEQNAFMGLTATDWGVVLDLGTNRILDRAEKILENPQIRELYLGSDPRKKQKKETP